MQTMLAFYDAGETLLRKLARLIALSLKLDATYFDEVISQPLASVRPLHYPPTISQPDEVRSACGAWCCCHCSPACGHCTTHLPSAGPAGCGLLAVDDDTSSWWPACSCYTTRLPSASPKRCSVQQQQRLADQLMLPPSHRGMGPCSAHCQGCKAAGWGNSSRIAYARHVPSLGGMQGIFGAGAHSDYGFITILATDDVPGLQVSHLASGPGSAVSDLAPRTSCMTLQAMMQFAAETAS